MSDDHRDAIQELVDRARDLGHHPTAVGLCEEAVRLADAHADLVAGFFARKALTRAAVFSGRPDLGLVSFTWCVAQADRHPDELDDGELLWQYKWVIENLPDFPHVSRAQIDGLFADMEARYRRHGSTLHAVHQIRRDVAVLMCDREAAAAAHARTLATPRDDLSNCPACVQDALIEFHLFHGDDPAAVAAADPILSGGLTCGEVPHRTHALVLLPLLRAHHAAGGGRPGLVARLVGRDGPLDRAVRSHAAGYRLIRDNPKFVRHQAYHLAFLSLTGNHGSAARLIERHLPDAAASPSGLWQFEFYAAARLALARLTDVGLDRPFRLPGDLPVGGPAAPADALAGWLDGQVAALAKAFDDRNGNDGFARRAAWFRDHGRYAVDRPIAA